MDDTSLNWTSLATTFVIQQDLATSASIVPSFAKDHSVAYQQGAAAALRTTIEKRGGKLRVAAVVTDLSTQRIRQTIESEGPENEGLIARLNSIGKALDPERASVFSTNSDTALQAFAAAVTAPNQEERTRLLTEAIHIDAAFGLAQSALVEMLPSKAASDLRIADRFTPYDRARYLALLARLNHTPLTTQLNAQSAVLRLAPNNVEALAELGWASFLQGKPADGERLLKKAIVLNPQNVNLQVQLAQGFVTARRFPEAIQILETLSGGNPNVLPGLAATKLLGGNVGGANETFAKLVNLIPAGSPTRTFVQEQWRTIAERRPPPPEMQGKTPLAPGYRAFLEKRSREAISFWQGIVQQTAGTDLPARTMLAAAREQAGQPRQIDVLPYIPDFADPYSSVGFNEMRRMLKM